MSTLTKRACHRPVILSPSHIYFLDTFLTVFTPVTSDIGPGHPACNALRRLILT